ncbi:MAG TPA: PIN domain-containing protein [bacterium]|nr:PIN domain-containing protein [bacterium]
MPERIQIHEINKLAGRTVFFDANVFLDIFWPTGRNSNTVLYSRLYKNCIQQQIPVAIDFIVLSEVINRALRIEYTKYLEEKGLTATSYSFKRYRDSDNGMQSQNDIYEIVKKSLEPFIICGKEYSKADVLSFMTVDSLDFNDKGIASLCLDKGFVLATSDKDFSTQDIPIISANY